MLGIGPRLAHVPQIKLDYVFLLIIDSILEDIEPFELVLFIRDALLQLILLFGIHSRCSLHQLIESPLT